MSQGHNDALRVEAMVQRAAVACDGYAMGVHTATTGPLLSWWVRVILPEGATASPGPETSWDPNINLATGAPQPVAAHSHGTAWLAITGTQHAPRSVQVTAIDDQGRTHLVPVVQVLANHPRTGQPTPTSQQNWPSSTGLLDGNSAAGSGGGGGGGGQYSCDLYVDLQKSIVTHRLTSDAGGGSGGGGGSTHNQENHHYRGQYE